MNYSILFIPYEIQLILKKLDPNNKIENQVREDIIRQGREQDPYFSTNN